MGLFEGKKGLIVGVANDHSIAWAIAQQIMQGGGECGFTHLPDRPDDKRRRNRHRVELLTSQYEQAKFLEPMDVTNDDDIERVMKFAGEQFGKLDFVLHSVAYADRADLNRDTVDTSRDGFQMAMEISAYSLIAITRGARPYMSERSSIAAMTYFGGEKTVPGYNVMGVCKAALDSIVKYLAFDLGPDGIRVNALSAGPIRTLAGRAAGVEEMLDLYSAVAPLGRNIAHEEVGKTGAFLLSDMSDGMTGEIMHVDGGYNAMGSPGRLLDSYREMQEKLK